MTALPDAARCLFNVPTDHRGRRHGAVTPAEFEPLRGQREGETLECKQERPSASDLATLITAFSTTRGGIVVFGVEDGTRRLGGVSNPQGVEMGLVNILRARCALEVMPSLECMASRLRVKGEV